MNGTEKQIKWAEEVKATFESLLWSEVEESNARVAIGDLPPVWSAAVYDSTVLLRESIEKSAADQSKFWIDNRVAILGYAKRVKELADKRCPQEQRMPALASWRAELGLAAV